MNEKQAWLYLSELWLKAERIGSYWMIQIPNAGWPNHCLCHSINSMGRNGLISYDVAEQMDARMEEHKPDDNPVYFWPRDGAGAQCRASFCYKMANLISFGDNHDQAPSPN